MIFGFIGRAEEGGMETRPSLHINLITEALSVYLVSKFSKSNFIVNTGCFRRVPHWCRISFCRSSLVVLSFLCHHFLLCLKDIFRIHLKMCARFIFCKKMTIWWKLDRSRFCARCRQVERQTDRETRTQTHYIQNHWKIRKVHCWHTLSLTL